MHFLSHLSARLVALVTLLPSIVAIILLIPTWGSYIFAYFFLVNFTFNEKKKSSGVKSGDLGGQRYGRFVTDLYV